MGVGIEACLPPGPAGSGVDSRALGDKTPAHRELGPHGGDRAVLSCRSAQHRSQPCLCGLRSEADVPTGMEDIRTAENTEHVVKFPHLDAVPAFRGGRAQVGGSAAS